MKVLEVVEVVVTAAPVMAEVLEEAEKARGPGCDSSLESPP